MRRIEAATVEDTRGDEQKLALRIKHILAHPNVPLFMLDLEASQLARFIAIRLKRSGGDTNAD